MNDLLKEAKSGDIQGIVISGSYSNARTFNVFELGGYNVALIGEMRITERDVVDCGIELRCPVAES